MSIVFALERTNQLSLLPDKDLVDLCPPIEPYQVTKNRFYDPLLRVRTEESVSLTIDDGEEILSGRIDVLVWLNQFWVVIVEYKKTALSVWTALPQTLAYLMANPRPEKPSFALVTNGDDILLVKLRANVHHYALSRIFAPFISREELYRVLQILKHIGAAVK